MTDSAITFHYQSGQRSLLPRRFRSVVVSEENQQRFSKAIQPVFEMISTKGTQFVRRKFFIKPDGNGCSHDKRAVKRLISKNPYENKGKPEHYVVQGKRFDEWGNKLRSNAQYKATQKTDQYYSNTDVMPSIEAARKALKRKAGGGKTRHHRSEGREGVCRVISTLLMSMDVHSLRVGRPDAANKKVFHYHSNESLAALSGLGMKRFQRHLELLQAAGVICMKRQYEKLENGEYVGKSSAIWFTRKFMKSMGLLTTFNRTSEQLTSREKKHQVRAVKTPDQLRAEATDELCRDASRIVSKKTVRSTVRDLFSFINEEDPPNQNHRVA